MISTAKSPRPRPILMVEDIDSDFETTMRGFRRLGVAAPVVRCLGIEDTTDFLKARREDRDKRELPGIVILDIRLTDGDGRDLLGDIKRDEHLKNIPVIVWSASDDPDTVDNCYRSGANSYIQKTTNRAATDKTIERFVSYWLETARLPRTSL